MHDEGHRPQEARGPRPGAGPEVGDSAAAQTPAPPRVTVIVNADDWGIRPSATDPILDCIRHGAVSSTSAMVYMEDSERAAELAREYAIDCGLHLNLTSAFTAARVPARLKEQHERVAGVLRRGRYAAAVFHPLLAGAIDYVVKAEMEEFARLYGAPAARVDGHHHMHLCANVQWQRLLPKGMIARRNFTFALGEKTVFNRIYRRTQDWRLARRHPMTDYFFDLVPPNRERMAKILEIARTANVEIEAHPEMQDEYEYLMGGELHRLGYEVTVARGYRLRPAQDFSAGGIALADRNQGEPPVRVVETAAAEPARGRLPHICVCICTYKRPQPLRRLLTDLNGQNTGGRFTYSIVVADNDEARSGEAVVAEAAKSLDVPVKYCAEPRKGISRARNKVIENAEGDFVALIDDDEFPTPDWLLNLFNTCRRYGVDGVLGPVRRHFDQPPPLWLQRSRLYDRSVIPTGMMVTWRGSRTGNALLKREVLAGDAAPFNVDLTVGEDQDFFRRKIEAGHTFVWSAEAVVYEVLPPARWKRTYYIHKAFVYGAHAARRPDCGAISIIKSAIAVPLYALGLPFALLAGQHRFMTLLVKLCDHAGKLLYLMRINPVREEYVSD